MWCWVRNTTNSCHASTHYNVRESSTNQSKPMWSSNCRNRTTFTSNARLRKHVSTVYPNLGLRATLFSVLLEAQPIPVLTLVQSHRPCCSYCESDGECRGNQSLNNCGNGYDVSLLAVGDGGGSVLEFAIGWHCHLQRIHSPLSVFT